MVNIKQDTKQQQAQRGIQNYEQNIWKICEPRAGTYLATLTIGSVVTAPIQHGTDKIQEFG
jgi:ACT domain-containing protein